MGVWAGSVAGTRVGAGTGLALLAAVSGAAACTTLIPGVLPHDIQRDAAKIEHDRCDPTPVDPRIYGVEVVESVLPYYRHVMGGPSGSETRFAGAEVRLRPLPGVTSELLERGLTCRSARLLLGHAVPLENEPYFLPGAWVKVDVRSGGGDFVVALAGASEEESHLIFDRARAFASRAGAPSP